MAKKFSPANNTDNHEIDLSRQFKQLARYKYKIITATILGGILGALYGFAATPTYQSNAMLEIETKQNQLLNEISSMLTPADELSPTEAEVELIKSRLVLGKTVNDLQLDQKVTPRYTPIIGTLLHNLSSDLEPQLEITQFTVQPDWINLPFTLKLDDSKHYTLNLPDGNSVQGQMGQLLTINSQTKLRIQQALSPTGQEFTLTKLSKLGAIDALTEDLQVISKGKTSPIINLMYSGHDRDQISVVLNSIIDNYILQNKDRDVQVAARGLAFISEELPRLKESLEDAEDKLNAYRQSSGSLDIPTEAKDALDSLSDIQSQITSLRTEEAGLAELYTPEHPSYKAVLDKLSVLENAKKRIDQQISDMPGTQQEIIRLTRNVDTNQSTYVQLLNKQQELNIMKASAQGNVRIVDRAATMDLPSAPRKKMIILLAALCAGILTAAWYLLKNAGSRNGLHDSEAIEAAGLNISARVPLSTGQHKFDNKRRRQKLDSSTQLPLLALTAPTDAAVEAVRSLRTYIHTLSLDSAAGVIMIAGTTPKVGRSFTAANLATVMAQSGKNILLVDCDMRCGYLHKFFEANPGNGLSDILESVIQPEQALQTTGVENLSIISHGTLPEKPSELLMDRNFATFITWAKRKFDHVILSTPPVLPVTDANIISRHSDTVFIVVREGQTTIEEINQCVARLEQSDTVPNGIIFNSISPATERKKQSYETAYGNTK